MHLNLAREFSFDVADQARNRNAKLLQQRWNEAVGLRKQGVQEMFGIDLLVGVPMSDLLCSLKSFLSFNCQTIQLHLI